MCFLLFFCEVENSHFCCCRDSNANILQKSLTFLCLFKASHVLDVKFNSSHDDFCFFEAKVKASMTRNKTYRTKVCQNKAGEVMSAQCTCKAGANGYCKHVGALLYAILDFSESDLVISTKG